MHYTDCHAQLMPIYFREPSINLGVGPMKGEPPHLVGKHFLDYYGIQPGTREAHAFTYLDFVEAAKRFGKVGGFAHLATLVKKVRDQRPGALLLDGGDTWQGSGTSYWTNAQDMVDAQKLLGVDIMTPHWEMTFGAERVVEIIENDFKGHIDFVAQNVVDNDWGEPVFPPYVIKEINGVPTAIIGQAFPYTPIANPRFLIPDWSFGIREDRMQKMVDEARGKGAQVVVVLSHNGMDVDLKLASRVTGIDAIMGGHTHDAIPRPVEVKNPGGVTLVTNAGSNSKFLGVLDLDVKNGKVQGYRYHLLPVFSNLLEADAAMAAYIDKARAPYVDRLNEELAVTDELLYRRGNFNGTFDQLICDALMDVQGAQIAFSPGFRWGVSVLPGEAITFEHVMTQTAITYPSVTLNNMSGTRIKEILEDVADNLFNKDPYYQQGGDMVRVGGLKYTIDPTQTIGKRISDMEFDGKPLNPDKEYAVAGWASVAQPLDTTPVWDVVVEYLRDKKTIHDIALNEPTIKGVANNPGYAD
jgi:sulfur-oxidizing protein SoxB